MSRYDCRHERARRGGYCPYGAGRSRTSTNIEVKGESHAGYSIAAGLPLAFRRRAGSPRRGQRLHFALLRDKGADRQHAHRRQSAPLWPRHAAPCGGHSRGPTCWCTAGRDSRRSRRSPLAAHAECSGLGEAVGHVERGAGGAHCQPYQPEGPAGWMHWLRVPVACCLPLAQSRRHAGKRRAGSKAAGGVRGESPNPAPAFS